MPPTVQTNKVPEREQRQNRSAEKRTELVCRIKYCNTLPDIPFDPKFIQYPFEASRFISYKPTTLERNYKYEVLTEHDLGVTIDLINKDAYNVEPGATLDPADEKLLEEDVLTPQDSIRSRHHARSVSWLRRTEYISTEQTRFQPQTMDKVEAKVGYSIKKNFKEDPLIMDRESQIKAIEKTFEDSLKPIEKHYSKPNVYPVEILPVYPDFSGWKYPCAQVIFDSDPAPVGRSVPAQLEEMSQAMIRGVMDESGEQFVAYFLPTEETLAKRRADIQNNIDYEDDQEYEYKMAREYNWNVKNKASKGYEENYFLVVREGGMYYNELETRVRLSKRRQKPGQAPSNTRLVIKHRPINELEYKMQRFRERQLEHPGEEDEEEPELEPETVTITRTGEKSKGSDDENKGSEDEKDESGDESERESDKRSNKDNDDKEDEASKNKSDNEGGSGSDADSKKSKSPSRSRSSSRSSAGSKGNRDRKSRSKSRGRSGSRSRSPSGSRSRSGSDVDNENDNDNESKKSRSRSNSRSSRSSSGSRKNESRKSRSQSRGGSGSRSGSGSSKSKSKSRSRSRSRSGSRSRSRSRSESGSDNDNKESEVEKDESDNESERGSDKEDAAKNKSDNDGESNSDNESKKSRSRSQSRSRSRSQSRSRSRSRSSSRSSSGSKVN